MTSNGRKMSNFTFRAIWIPIVAFLFVFIFAGTIVANVFRDSLDTYLGMGTRSVMGTDLSIKDEDKDYYQAMYGKIEDARDASFAVSTQISDEGIVLLKNNGTLPVNKKDTVSPATVTPFGFFYLNPVYGGVGSGNVDVSEDYVYTAVKGINEYFNVNNLTVTAMQNAKPQRLAGDGAGWVDTGMFPVKQEIEYYAASVYDTDAVRASCRGTVGLVFIGRPGGEGSDLYSGRDRNGYADGTRHALALTQEELKTVRFAKENCASVVLIVNSSNVMELRPVMEGEYECDAVLQVAGPGASGFKSLPRILTGEVNPSAKTVDIWATDFTADPTYANFGEFEYANGDVKYLEYEEGVYLGYKYYETMHADGENTFTVNGQSGKSYADAVVFPFGYGLGYDNASVSQTLDSVEYKNDTVTVKGTIKNLSSKYDAKETVQIYWGADYKNVERAAKNLVAFEKYDVKMGQSVNFEISFPAEDMASYDYKGYYSSGAGSYVLEAGEYKIYLGKDSHDSWGTGSVQIGATQVYLENDGHTATNGGKLVGKRAGDSAEAINRFGDVSAYMETGEDVNLLTRKGGLHNSRVSAPQGTFTDDSYLSDFITDKAASDAVLKGVEKFNPNTDPQLGNRPNDAPPVEKADNGLVVSQLRGLDFDDPRWNDLLDQLDYEAEDLLRMLSAGAYNTGAVAAVGKNKTLDYDGPQGLTTFMGKLGTCAWTSEVMIASAWNKVLAKEMGRAVGQEALTIGINGWYAPAMNLHRSPFSGRNFEYYSEDPVLSGYLGAAVTEGAMENGLYVYVKHFAVNDQETNREGVCTWATEQALRELYYKPFEICIKTAQTEIKYIDIADDGQSYTVKSKPMRATTGIMTAMNRIGTVRAAEDKALLTDVTRGEWGFNGIIETDMGGASSLDRMLRAGCDVFMTFGAGGKFDDVKSNTFKIAARNAVKDVLYAYVNSNAMQGVEPGGKVVYAMSPWAIWLLVLNIAVYLFIAGMTVWMILRALDEKKHPEKYKNKKRGA